MKNFKPKAREIPGEVQLVNADDYHIMDTIMEQSSNQIIKVMLRPLDSDIRIRYD